MQGLPFESTFDQIWLFSVFSHLNPVDSKAMLSLLRRYIRPDGYLFFTAGIQEFVDEFVDASPADRDPLTFALYGRQFMDDLVLSSGWSIVSVTDPDPQNLVATQYVCSPKVD